MKKRTLILASALFLAIGGAFAYKSTVTEFQYFYLSPDSNCDDILYSTQFCPGTTFDCTDYVGGVSNVQLYTNSNCTTKAKRD